MVRAEATLPKLASLPPPEADVQELLYRFDEAVHYGFPCAFATLRSLWQEMNLSFLFEARPLHLTREDFYQSLFASALDCLQVPLRPRRQIKTDSEPQEGTHLSNTETGQPTLPASAAPYLAACGPSAGSQHASTIQGTAMSLAELIESDEEMDILDQQQQQWCARSVLSPHAPWETSTSDAFHASTVCEHDKSSQRPAPATQAAQAASHQQHGPASRTQLTSQLSSCQPGNAAATKDVQQFLCKDCVPCLLRPGADMPAILEKLPKASSPNAAAAPVSNAMELCREVLDLLPDLRDLSEEEAAPFSEDGARHDDPQAHLEIAAAPPGSNQRQLTNQACEVAEPREPVPEVVRIGSVFLLYALFYAQTGEPRVYIYLPLQLLRGLTWMAGRSVEADACLRKLVEDNAFVVGAVRRPISGTLIARQAGMSVRTILRPDKTEQMRITRQALRRIKMSSEEWSSLQHIQLLCNSYRTAQNRLWGGEVSRPQGLFDLNTGDTMGQLVKEVQASIARLLPYSQFSKFLQNLERRKPEGKAHQTRLEAAPKQALEAEQQQVVQAAAKRRIQRYAHADEGDDEMPSLQELGIQVPGATDGAAPGGVDEAELDLLPQAARLVEVRKAGEQREYRRSMRDWQSAFQCQQIDSGDATKAQQRADKPSSAGRPGGALTTGSEGPDAAGQAAKLVEKVGSHRQDKLVRTSKKPSSKRRTLEEPSATDVTRACGQGKQTPTQPSSVNKRKALRASEAASDSLQLLAGSAASVALPQPRRKQRSEQGTELANRLPARDSIQLSEDGACRGSNGVTALLHAAERIDDGTDDDEPGSPGSQRVTRRGQTKQRAGSRGGISEDLGLVCTETTLDLDTPSNPGGDGSIEASRDGNGLNRFQTASVSRTAGVAVSNGFNDKQAATLQALMDADAEAARLLDEL